METDAPARGGIEPSTIKRRGVGLRGYDPARAFPGFTLFAPNRSPERRRQRNGTTNDLSP